MRRIRPWVVIAGCLLAGLVAVTAVVWHQGGFLARERGELSARAAGRRIRGAVPDDRPARDVVPARALPGARHARSPRRALGAHGRGRPHLVQPLRGALRARARRPRRDRAPAPVPAPGPDAARPARAGAVPPGAPARRRGVRRRPPPATPPGWPRGCAPSCGRRSRCASSRSSTAGSRCRTAPAGASQRPGSTVGARLQRQSARRSRGRESGDRACRATGRVRPGGRRRHDRERLVTVREIVAAGGTGHRDAARDGGLHGRPRAQGRAGGAPRELAALAGRPGAAGGDARFEGEITGSWREPAAAGTLAVRDLVVGGRRWPQARGQVGWGGGRSPGRGCACRRGGRGDRRPGR